MSERVTSTDGRTYDVVPVRVGVDATGDAYAELHDGTDVPLDDLVILRPTEPRRARGGRP